MVRLLEKASAVIPVDQLWVNPDCGLKTRHWDETKKVLTEMVTAAQKMRAAVESPVNESFLFKIFLFFLVSTGGVGTLVVMNCFDFIFVGIFAFRYFLKRKVSVFKTPFVPLSPISVMANPATTGYRFYRG
jgi:Cobalamin-independent synthase, Catalytic domain